jgi:hypothetical protein
LSNVTIWYGVTTIGDQAFVDCTALTNITIPKSLAAVGNYAFNNCLNLTNVNFLGDAPLTGSWVFDGDPGAIAYYFAGAAGWGPTLDGIPTVELNQAATAGPAYYSRPTDVSLLIKINDLLTNVTVSAGDTVTLTGVGTDGFNLRSTNGATLFTNSTFILYTNSASPNVNDSFNYTVTDAVGQMATGTVYIILNNNVVGQGSPKLTISTSNLTAAFFGIPGFRYIVERSTNLVQGAGWLPISTNTAGTLPATDTNTEFAESGGGSNIDPRKWTTSGNTVVESGGLMQVLTTVTDQPGTLTSTPFVISNSGLITITRQVFLHHDDSIYYLGNNHFFTGIFAINIAGVPQFGIEYCDYDFSGNGRQPAYGFFVTRNGASATFISSQSDVSSGVAAIWDTWFSEKIIYDPSSGQLQYFINNVLQVTFNVGAMPVRTSPTMSLLFQAYGWWTGHEQLFSNLAVTQAVIPPAVGGLIQVTDNFEDLGIVPASAYYRLRYDP